MAVEKGESQYSFLQSWKVQLFVLSNFATNIKPSCMSLHPKFWVLGNCSFFICVLCKSKISMNFFYSDNDYLPVGCYRGSWHHHLLWILVAITVISLIIGLIFFKWKIQQSSGKNLFVLLLQIFCKSFDLFYCLIINPECSF